MERSRRVTIVALVLVCFAGAAGCGGSARQATPNEAAAHVVYRPGHRLDVHVTSTTRQGPLRVQQLSYTSADGQRVPALFAIPTRNPPLGCLIYQGGLGQVKEANMPLRAGFGNLRLATFTIDPRNGGARGSAAQMAQAIKKPETLLSMVLGTVVDLREGLDYLERRRECHHNIAYMGTSFGGVVGTLLTAQDPRIKAAVLTSIGPTFKEAMLVGSVAARKIHDLPVQVPGAATNPAVLAHAVRILSPYDPVNWVSQIAPRPVMLINGRFDPLVPPIDALNMAAAAGAPKTVLYFNGGHDPLAAGPDQAKVALEVSQFLISNLSLPSPF